MTTTCRCCGRFPLARLMAAGLQSKTSDERRALFATGRPTRPPPAASSASGYLFTGGTILTMDDSQPTVEALLIQGDKVAYAGSVGALPSPLPDGIQVIPLGKNVLLPGFVDPHMHLLPSALNSLMVDLTPQAFTKQGYTIDNVLAALADAVDKALPFGLVLGQGYDSSLLKPWVNLTVAKLDSISKKDIAILVQAGSGHLTFANSTAMKLADIDPPDGPPTPDPFGGYIGRYGEGNSDDKPPGSASGIFVEMPAQSLLKPAMEKRLASLIEDLKRKDPIAAVMQNAVAVGNTLINDAGIGLVTDYEGDKLILEGVFAWGQPVRVASAMFLDEWDASSLPDAFSKGPDFSNPMFVHQAVKLFADGSNQGLTGFLTKPYSPWALEQAQADFLGTHIYGNADDISVDADADAGGTALPLSSLMQQAIANGWQVMIHANGDAGIDNALSAYSAANAEASPDLRHRIEHCSILRDDQLEKMKTLGLSPSFLIAHTTVWGGVLQEILNDDSNPGRANLLDRCQSALGKNMRISLHTDHPVTPLGPLQMIQDAVTRVMQTNGQVLNKAECLSPEQAVRAQTIDAAWQCHMDDLVGSLEVGKLADLVILDRSPLDGDPSTISKIQVVETWVGGKKVYASGTEKRVTGGG